MSEAEEELGPEEWIERVIAAKKEGLKKSQFLRKYDLSTYKWVTITKRLGIIKEGHFPRSGGFPKGTKKVSGKKEPNVVSYHTTPLREAIPCAPIKKRMYLLLVSLDRATLVQLLEEAEENKILHTFS